MRFDKKGFSLIELLVALSTLAVVAAIIVPNFLNLQSQSEATVIAQNQSLIQNAYDQWASLGGQISVNGTVVSSSGYDGALAPFLALVSQPAPRSPVTFVTENGSTITASDSPGPAGSSTIGISGITLTPVGLSGSGNNFTTNVTWSPNPNQVGVQQPPAPATALPFWNAALLPSVPYFVGSYTPLTSYPSGYYAVDNGQEVEVFYVLPSGTAYFMYFINPGSGVPNFYHTMPIQN